MAIGNTLSPLKFTAENLEDIAQHFLECAESAQQHARRQTTKKEARYYEGQNAAYRNAADFLRKTKLV